ncbi:hypothetical protein [Bacillus pumilus]|uniref:hypothetical protein n=1 Tax=Bacillus pumilus TaxID=1408 RepID=UPI00165344F8|nr:hypothetical protein [Bacillus pumilus]
MTKRKGLLNELSSTSTSSTAPKEKIKQFEVLDYSMLVFDALKTMVRQIKMSGNRCKIRNYPD